MLAVHSAGYSPLLGGHPNWLQRPEDGYITAYGDGFAADGRFCVVERATGAVLTSAEDRLIGRLSLSYAREDRILRIATGTGSIEVAFEQDPPIEVEGLGGTIEACPASSEASNWLSDFLGRDVVLVYREGFRKVAITPQGVDPQLIEGNLPYRIISLESIRHVNQATGARLEWSHLGYTIVVQNAIRAFEEDSWKIIQLNPPSGPKFELVRPVKFQGVEEYEGNGHTKDVNRYLAINRSRKLRQPDGSLKLTIAFGYLMRNLASGPVQVGQRVEVLERR